MKYPEPRIWIPKFPEKYDGNANNIVARSSWEIKFFNWCDNRAAVIKWSSEETIIPYRCATDSKIHRYYLDAKIQVKNKDGLIKTFLVEIKPKVQCYPPKYPGRQTKRYLTESLTFMKNQSKWEAARAYAIERGWKFVVLTEDDLGI